MQQAMAIRREGSATPTRVASILGWVVLVVSIAGFAACMLMLAWGVGRLNDALVVSTIEMHTDRLLEAEVPQPVIECVRVGEPVEAAGFTGLDADTRDLVEATVGQIDAVRLQAGVAEASGRRTAVLVAMLCTGMMLVGLFVITRSRRDIIGA